MADEVKKTDTQPSPVKFVPVLLVDRVETEFSEVTRLNLEKAVESLKYPLTVKKETV